jgi:hypothetical protein
MSPWDMPTPFDAFLQTQGRMRQNDAQEINNQFNLEKLSQLRKDQELESRSRQVSMRLAQAEMEKSAPPATTLANLSEMPDFGAESQGLKAYDRPAIPATAKIPKQSDLLAEQADKLKAAALQYGAAGDTKQQNALMKESDQVREKLYLNQREERMAEAQRQKEAAGAMMAINSQPALDEMWANASAEHRKGFAPYFNIGLDGKPIYDGKARESLNFFGMKSLDAEKQTALSIKALNEQIAAQKAETERLRLQESERHNKATEALGREGNKIKATVAETKAAPSDEGTLTPDAIEEAATNYYLNRVLPPNLGRGAQRAVITAKILNRAAEVAKEQGSSPENTAISQMANKANQQAMGQLSKQQQMVGAFEKNAIRNADIAVSMSDKVSRTGVPVLNRWILAGQKSITGDVDVAKFHQANETFVNEYAKIMSGSMGNTVVSDSLRKETHEMLATKNTPEQYRAVVDQMKVEMGNRMKGFDEQMSELKGGIKSKSAIPKISDDAGFNALKSGQKFIAPDGTTRTKP